MADAKPLVTAVTDVVFSTTDKFGCEIYLTQATVSSHWYRDIVLTDYPGHEDALKDPQLLAIHVEDRDKRIYIGKPWDLPDASLGSRQRMLVVLMEDTARGRILTAINKSTTSPSGSLGKIIFEST
jgi:hypothetical protein